MKHRASQSSINKNQILQWINSTLNGNQTKIQSLGNGIIYCMLINHYYPNSIPANKIIMMPKNNMDNKTNLKKVQQALHLQNIKSITFDIFRVSQMSYLDNWQLVTKLYKHFDQLAKNNQKEIQKVNHTQNHQSVNMNMNQSNINMSQSNINISQSNLNISQNINQGVNQMIHHPQLMSQPQTILTLPKQISKPPDFSTGLLTPMKGLKYFEQNTKMRYESLKLMQQIKNIVKSQTQSDKVKVKSLKRMLGLIEEQTQQEQQEMKQLFSDCKQKQQVITID